MSCCILAASELLGCWCACQCSVSSCRDLVHRQTACWAVKHMALGVYGFGFEDAMTHLFNLVWPNMFEVSPHMVQAFTDAVDGMRVSVGPGKVLSYLLQARHSVGLPAQRRLTLPALSPPGPVPPSAEGARCVLEDLQQPVHWGSSMTCTCTHSMCACTHHTLVSPCTQSLCLPAGCTGSGLPPGTQ